MQKSLFAALAVVVLWPISAAAGPATFSFSNGSRAASVKFERSGSDLIVTLTNTSTADALVPTDILGGVFFKLSGDPALTRTSGLLYDSNVALVGGTGADVTPGDLNVGGEWAYLNGLSPSFDANQGISSVGLGIFGPFDLFPGPDLDPPPSPDGVNFGITTAGDNLLTGNGGISGFGLIKNSVKFTLGGFSGEPDALITKVFFQYGTGLDEPRFEVPEPASLIVTAIGCLGAATLIRRRRGP